MEEEEDSEVLLTELWVRRRLWVRRHFTEGEGEGEEEG